MQVEITELFRQIAGDAPVIQALVGGIIIALLNLLGASLVLVWRNPSERALDTMLGFAAGVMLAAAFTSLIIPGIEEYSGGNPVPTLIGVGFGAAAGDPAQLGGALSLMVAIGMQNVPEGLAVSVAAVNAGLDRRAYAAVAGVRAGVVEIPLAVLGAVAVATVEPLLPYAMGFAAGAMLFVISDEIIPETHRSGYEPSRSAVHPCEYSQESVTM
ncbi:hypothetical protein BRD19_06425 [Halobacteriales archaeon SW_7_65_23]|nr:MAG: hypothetical protein BRD19_06425 [Halobacteriales archaeon SW_7_65_23]